MFCSPAGPDFGPTRRWTCQDPSPRLSSNYSLSAKENTPFRLYFRSARNWSTSFPTYHTASRLVRGDVSKPTEAGSARPVISFWRGGPMGRCRLPHPVLQDKGVGEHDIGLNWVSLEGALLRG